ncbi:unnamed protein product [Rotaria magnacalcarata]|uniref:Transmembrane protein n=3 Tax=Rotaria magnacalcarata TaxID=392030 RepID=A0A816TUF2_9BILA|nr:unnamed protein product [Rotaria magnacalcarata]CAF5040150.1 unnamed protein product [Rotaria magnacalcarata]
MAKFTNLIKIITSVLLIILVHLSTGMDADDRCDNNIFVLISSKNVFILNFDVQGDYSPSIIYRAQSDATIENGFFNKRTNKIILLINQLNQTYSIIILNVNDDIYKSWIEKSTRITYSTYVSLAQGQRYLYVLNKSTLLLQIFALPFTSTSYKENYLTNLPKNQTLLNYIVDEKFYSLWILFKNIQSQLYVCDLRTYNCHLYMNIINLHERGHLSINWKYQQFYIYSKENLLIFEYNQNQTDYSINYLDFPKENQDQFLTVCAKTDNIEYLSINYDNKQQACYRTCQYLPSAFDDKSRIHTVERLSTISDVLYCSKKRRISKIVVLILILADILVILAVIAWLAYKYFHYTTLNDQKHAMSDGTISASEKTCVTHF